MTKQRIFGNILDHRFIRDLEEFQKFQWKNMNIFIWAGGMQVAGPQSARVLSICVEQQYYVWEQTDILLVQK